MNTGSDVVVLFEHWLWPYELHKVHELNSSYQGLGKADSRLSETADELSRGCGGVGILWTKSFDVIPISDIQSDRIGGIRIKKERDDEVWISTIGVNLPCLDLGVELYCESLIERESAISESEHWGPVIIARDFNAHLGTTWGPRAHKNPNLQGVLLGEVLDSCKLHAVSLGETTSGPSYTYLSGETTTIVDYILTDIEAGACVDCCYIHDDIDLNFPTNCHYQ